jgi:polysaccharide pyruvyl transferase WcaK-like protein
MGHGALNDVFNPFMLCFTYYLAGRLNKPLFISGQTIGPVWREQSRRMLNNTLPNAHTLALRDNKLSHRELVENIGFRSDTTRLVEVGDDTLDLPAVAPDFSCLPANAQLLLENGRFIAVQWRMSDYTAAVSKTQQLIPIIEAVRLLYKETGLTPLFVPLSWEMGHSDILAAARIKDYLQDEIPFQVIWHYLSAQQVKWLLGRARFGLGLSYHFHVFLLTQGIPTIGLYTNPYYELKLKGVYAAYGYEGQPSPYETNITDLEQRLSGALSIINSWTEVDAAHLISNASSLSTQWHRAFKEFIIDSDLGGIVSEPEF